MISAYLQPAISLPLHQTADGLPCGVQFMAVRGNEHRLYQLAGKLEQSPYWLDIRKNPSFYPEISIRRKPPAKDKWNLI
ncbi:amidase family protein [Thalassobacillus cyri]|uniref:amidase family protein n=1 Tax=Thalassobacillus cyri TaxID=571932 RepID=UPI000B8974F6|nr:amidase family protein [Thalassobacillus cyri]